MSTHDQREVRHVVTAHRQKEGAGFIVRRPLPAEELELADPFLMLDEIGPVRYGPGEAVGAPDHPHRGIETVSYVLAGELEHEDSVGHHGILGSGDVQWMTAGGGIVHSEMPSRRIIAEGGLAHGFQIWVNLPARDKMMAPRYQEIPAVCVPEATTPDDLAHVRVIAGEALGMKALIETRTAIAFHHWTLQPGAQVDVPVPVSMNACIYVFAGRAQIGAGARALGEGQLGVLGAGTAVRLACAAGEAQPARLLLLAGVPLGEPVVWQGPFVMNTHEEIEQAIRDYRSGRMGRIRRAARPE